ncbi:LAMI_0A02828g1_1 [Lachancea mirantina]|uniref:LAMI_0A02828g1_1 n=1 Tax=Lachancea mirantina TaxID=1230905 RepID=A0A1G4IMR0_9SACH|nr:LAMI_0A02828g1_1 [Lachancea mirantina]
MVQQDVVTATIIKSAETQADEQFLFLRHAEYHTAKGIAGILTVPSSSKLQSLKAKILEEPQQGFPLHKLVLLVHGHSAHKNTVFLPAVAKTLARKGYYVLRIDFRGLGDSENCRDPRVGRVISQDVEDIETVYQFAASEAIERIIGHKLTLDTIMAHSRGVMSMFEFARSRFVPNLINASGRFVSSGLLDKSYKRNPNWDEDGGFNCSVFRNGKPANIWIPKAETMSAAMIDTRKFAEIDSRTWVLSIYGSCDNVIPISALAQWANLFEGRHTAGFIMFADHNFYGLPGDPNLDNLPLRKGVVNYNGVVAERVAGFLEPESQLQRFYKVTNQIIDSSNPARVLSRWPLPFEFSGISNFRDIGGYRTRSGHRVKPGIMYRCANPSNATHEGIDYLKNELHVTRFFDLRAPSEIKENGFIKAVPIENLPFNNKQSFAPEDSALHYQGLLLSPYMFPQAYLVISRNSASQIKQFFEYVRDGHCDEQHALAFNCAAGKDRTGVLAMLILGLLGVDDDTIAREYELTTIGLTTEQRLIDRLQKRGDLYYEMVGSKGLAQEYNVDPVKMCQNLLSSKYEAMRLFLDQFRKLHGSFEQYFINSLQITGTDILQIKQALLE